ncbi:MAG: cytochrome ubiquinol oxidase subunit I [Holophaga sp.]|nr:cytochrome ubiquinol oxidase subunit I [Holophaga sp.]
MTMGDLLFWHRLQFGFTATFHYLFPQLTMGLALIILVLKGRALARGDEACNTAARFWIRIFGLSFAVGVVTGIPLEFQFGTNWARFSSHAGGVIGQTLGMEGMFAFFLESTFLGLLVWGERRLSPRLHFLAALALFVGSWLSGYFIIATNAFMQHPVGYQVAADGSLQLASFWTFLLNPWAIVQYLHNMMGATVTGAFAVAAVGAFWTLRGTHLQQAALFLKTGVIVGFLASLLVAFPTGDQAGKRVARHQQPTLAAMEGRWHSGPYAELNLIGQPNVAGRTLDNPVRLPGLLSFIAYGSFSSNVKGLDEFPPDQWPTNLEFLYYGFHIMVGLGTLFIALMGLSTLCLALGRLQQIRPLLWVLMLAFPFPFIANSAGWVVAEFGRQPWLVYGLLRTGEGTSQLVHPGQTVFTSLGFAGLYFVLGLLFLFLVGREVNHGPVAH